PHRPPSPPRTQRQRPRPHPTRPQNHQPRRPHHPTKSRPRQTRSPPPNPNPPRRLTSAICHSEPARGATARAEALEAHRGGGEESPRPAKTARLTSVPRTSTPWLLAPDSRILQSRCSTASTCPAGSPHASGSLPSPPPSSPSNVGRTSRNSPSAPSASSAFH